MQQMQFGALKTKKVAQKPISCNIMMKESGRYNIRQAEQCLFLIQFPKVKILTLLKTKIPNFTNIFSEMNASEIASSKLTDACTIQIIFFYLPENGV